MNTNDHIDKLIDAALNSTDGAGRASPKPYLFTRLKARLDRGQESSWEKAARFIARPVVALAGLCLVISINALVIAYNNTPASNNTGQDQLATTDEFTTSVTALYYAENTEP